ncbi:MAG: hypothetical protein ACKVOW_18690 [Chitinophagaceae bacterium]
MEDGTHTYDIFKEGTSKQKVGTKEFAQAVIANLGSKPAVLRPVHYAKKSALILPKYKRRLATKKELVGVDVFVHWNGSNPDELASLIHKTEKPTLKLSMITNRGIKVYPDGFKETFCTDHWRCRFKPSPDHTIIKSEIIDLLSRAVEANVDTIKTENLYSFDGKPGFFLGQGQ